MTNRRFLSASAGGERERLAAVVRESLEGGLGAVQLREKDLTAGTLLEYARTVREITAHHGAPLLVNDRVDVALASGAEGVHVGGASLPAFEVKRLAPGLLVGVSCHSVREVQEAEQSGADYVFLGPIYDTPSKRSFGPPLGPDALREASACSRVALIAIGGITPGRAPEAIEAGASGVAVMGWILSAADPRRAAADLAEAVGGARGAALRPPSQSSGDPEAPEARRPAATT